MLSHMESALRTFVESHQRLFVLTGAGCSTNSGTPDYRDSNGNWKRTPPIRYQAFIAEELTRHRYWARSMIGWRRFEQALPNNAHHALARLEAKGQWTGCTRPPGAGRSSTSTGVWTSSGA